LAVPVFSPDTYSAGVKSTNGWWTMRAFEMLISDTTRDRKYAMRIVLSSDLGGIRKTFKSLGAVVAEIDPQLRYVWVDNPHPDFQAKDVIGKTDDELIPAREAEQIIGLKRDTFISGLPQSRIIEFNRSDGVRSYSMQSYPIVNSGGHTRGILTVGFEVSAE